MTTNKNFKKHINILAVACAMVLVFASCKKEAATNEVTDDEVAEIVTESVSGASGGMVSQTETSAQNASNTTLLCGASSDTTITASSTVGSSISYNYNLLFKRSLVCNNGVPNQFNITFSGTTNYTTARMISNDNSNAQVAISGLQPIATNYVFNENYVRNGTQQSLVKDKRLFNSKLTITSTNINVSKSTLKIVSGTATVQFDATTSDNLSVSKSGTLKFLGNSKATLTLDNGSSYTIQW